MWNRFWPEPAALLPNVKPFGNQSSIARKQYYSNVESTLLHGAEGWRVV